METHLPSQFQGHELRTSKKLLDPFESTSNHSFSRAFRLHSAANMLIKFTKPNKSSHCFTVFLMFEFMPKPWWESFRRHKWIMKQIKSREEIYFGPWYPWVSNNIARRCREWKAQRKSAVRKIEMSRERELCVPNSWRKYFQTGEFPCQREFSFNLFCSRRLQTVRSTSIETSLRKKTFFSISFHWAILCLPTSCRVDDSTIAPQDFSEDPQSRAQHDDDFAHFRLIASRKVIFRSSLPYHSRRSEYFSRLQALDRFRV